ncbi:MAG: PqqD family protein [Bacteroidales bacterium]|nr:PqqD family protein [Bacteroidales bacterium]
MKINPNYKMREVCGEHIILMQGAKSGDLTRLVSFNESSLLLWEKLYGKDFELADATALLTETYDVDEATAQHDAEQWIETLKSNGIIL